MYNIRVSFAGVMELVDVTDSKSVGVDIVSVRVRPPAPSSETLGISTIEVSSVSFFNLEIQLFFRLFSPEFSHTLAWIPGAILNAPVIFKAEVLLDDVSKWTC